LCDECIVVAFVFTTKTYSVFEVIKFFLCVLLENILLMIKITYIVGKNSFGDKNIVLVKKKRLLRKK